MKQQHESNQYNTKNMWKKKKLILKTKKNLYKSHPDRDESLELLIYFYNTRLIHNLYIYFVGLVHGRKFKCLFAELQSKRNVKYDAIKICFYLKEYPRQKNCTYIQYEKAHACQCFSIYSWSYSHNLLLDNNFNEYKQHNLKQTLFIFLLLYIYIFYLPLISFFFPDRFLWHWKEFNEFLMNIYILQNLLAIHSIFKWDKKLAPSRSMSFIFLCVFLNISLLFFFRAFINEYVFNEMINWRSFVSDESFLFCLLLLCFFYIATLNLNGFWRYILVSSNYVHIQWDKLDLLIDNFINWFADWNLFYLYFCRTTKCSDASPSVK